MLVHKDLNKLLSELVLRKNAKIQLDGFPISIRMEEKNQSIYLSTPVYYGGNYIPKSVRGCLQRKAPFDHLVIKTNLVIEEENYSVILNFSGQLNEAQSFIELLEDFTWLAGKWRDYLDEHDKFDLVHIYAR